MSTEQEILKLLTIYTKRNSIPQTTYSAFLGFLEKTLQQTEFENGKFEDLRHDPHHGLSAALRNLEKQRQVYLIRSENHPLSILVPSYFIDIIEKQYSDLVQQMHTHLPTESILGFTLPEHLIQAVDVKTEIINWLIETKSEPNESDDEAPAKPFLRLLFPDNLPSIICTREILKEKMVIASVQKIRQYLYIPKNMAYIKQKLTPVFRGKEVPLRDVLQQILTSPEQSAKGILNATDFLFQFWTHLSTNIIKEFADKQDKLIEEQNYTQAAYLLGYYSVYCIGIEQRKKDSEAGLKNFIQSMKKPPYAFSINEIYDMTNDKGVKLLQKYSKEQLHSYIAENMKSSDGKSLPVLMRTNLPNGKEYYITYDSVPLIIASQLPKAQKGFREYYLFSWQAAFLEGKKLNTIESEETFKQHVETRFRERFPLLFSILRFDILYLLSQEATTKSDLRQAILGLLDLKNQEIKPYTDILNLDHHRLLGDVKIMLPFWIVVPIIKDIVSFFRQFFLGKEYLHKNSSNFDHEGQEFPDSSPNQVNHESTRKQIGSDFKSIEREPQTTSPKSNPNPSQSAKAQKAAFKEDVQKIAGQFTFPGKNLEQSLSISINHWNPLLDQKAKMNLVEDVNSMCRDFLRGLKMSYRKPPPTPDALREMAKRLSENTVFDRIRNRDALREYIELYFLKILSQ